MPRHKGVRHHRERDGWSCANGSLSYDGSVLGVPSGVDMDSLVKHPRDTVNLQNVTFDMRVFLKVDNMDGDNIGLYSHGAQLGALLWLDKDTFKYCDLRCHSGDDSKAGVSLVGSFTMPVGDGIPDLMKIELDLKNFTDPKSGNTVNTQFVAGAIELGPLLTNKQNLGFTNENLGLKPATSKSATSKSILTDSFCPGNEAEVFLTVSRGLEKPIKLNKSALWLTHYVNEEKKRISQKLHQGMTGSHVLVTPGSGGFVEGEYPGLTTWPMGGIDKKIPALGSSYPTLHSDFCSLDRALPTPVLVYNLHLYLAGRGKTLDMLEQENDLERARSMIGIMTGFTFDAGICKYNRDFSLKAAFDLSKGFMVTTRDTEIMSLPCSAAAMCGRKVADYVPVSVKPNASMKDCHDILEANSCTVSEQNVALQTDDCENSVFLGKLFGNAWMQLVSVFRLNGNPGDRLDVYTDWKDRLDAYTDMNNRLDGTWLKEECKDATVFAAYTDRDWGRISKIFMDGLDCLRKGVLQTFISVGLAGSPNPDLPGKGLGGHCFGNAIITYLGNVFHGIFEGTTCLNTVYVGPDVCRVKTRVSAVSMGGAPMKETIDSMNLPKYLSCLGVSMHDHVCVLGELLGPNRMEKENWKTSTRIRGHSRIGSVYPDLTTMHEVSKLKLDACDLNSDGSGQSSKDPRHDLSLPFYYLLVYSGMQVAPGGVGALLVDEETKPNHVATGCPLHFLASPTIRAASADMTDEMQALTKSVMNEAFPPIAPRSVIMGIVNHWAPLPSISSENVQERNSLDTSMEYIRVPVYQTPLAPELTPVIYHIKKTIAEECNRLQASSEHSDGAVFGAKMIGTGAMFYVDYPVRRGPEQENPHVGTCVASMKQACKNLQVPIVLPCMG